MQFPQIGNGAVAQYPARRVRKWRAIANEMDGGDLIQLADSAAGEIDWRLSFQELTVTESAALTALFTATQGGFGSFLFVDPFANLLAWSEDLTRPDWQTGLLQISGGTADPLGTQRASTVRNTAAGAVSLQQTIGVPGDYVCSFSVWMRAALATPVTLARDARSASCVVGPAWKRFSVSGAGNAGAAQSTLAVTVPAGQSIDVWGLQAEAQPAPSTYKQSGTALGIYAETRFADDELTMVSTGVGLSSCDVRLVSRVG